MAGSRSVFAGRTQAREFAWMDIGCADCGESWDGGLWRSSVAVRLTEMPRNWLELTSSVQTARNHDAVVHAGKADEHRDAVTANFL